MNLGRTERLYTRAHRRAVIARDKGCVFEGCNAAVQHCEIHHIKYWERDNGDTSIENAALIFRFHHSRVHNEILEIIKDPAGLPHAVPATKIHIRPATQTEAGPETGPGAGAQNYWDNYARRHYDRYSSSI